MDFHSFTRRDLQSLCKKNKIPANLTNVAMADALTSLEIVEGLDEYMNQSDSNAPRSPTSVAKQPPKTATRTTRRKTAVKAERQSSSQLLPHLTSETDKENVNKNVAQEPKTSSVKLEAQVAKTPAARSTRKASAATSCSIKKDVSVQSVYNTRKSTRLLEKCMADLSLKTNETLDKPAKKEDTVQKVSSQEKNPSGSEEKSEEAEVIASRDLSASMEKEWKFLKNDYEQVVEDLEIHVGLDNIAVFDANTETTMEKTTEIMDDEKEPKKSLIQLDKQGEMLQVNKAMCEEGPKKNDNDQERGDFEIYVNHGELPPVLEYASTETNDNNEESLNILPSDGSVQVDQQETEHAIQENGSESEKINKSDEDTLVDQTEVDQPETEHPIQEKDSEPEKINNQDGDTLVDQPETEQAVQENGSESEKTNKSDEDTLVDQLVDQPETEQAVQENGSESEKTNKSDEDTLVDQTQVDQPETEHRIQEKDYEAEEINNVETVADQFVIAPEEDNSGVDSDYTISEADSKTEKTNKSDEVALVDQTQVDQPEPENPIQVKDYEPDEINNVQAVADQSEIEPEEDNSDDRISEADSNQAVLGSDIADEDVVLFESEVSAAVPTSPRFLEEAKVKTTPSSPFATELISVQFPRPNKTTTPLKKSAMKMVNVDKENDKELMMNVHINDNGESKGDAKMMKKVEIDEENLKEVSMRQLVKMVKALSIKNSNRTALQILPGNNNNQIAE